MNQEAKDLGELICRLADERVIELAEKGADAIEHAHGITEQDASREKSNG